MKCKEQEKKKVEGWIVLAALQAINLILKLVELFAR